MNAMLHPGTCSARVSLSNTCDGPTRSVGNALGHRAITRDRQIGSARADRIALPERLDQVQQPMRIGKCIVIKIRDDVACGGVQARVSGDTEPEIFLFDQSHWESPGDVTDTIGGTVVDNDHFKIGIVLLQRLGDRLFQRGGSVVTADDD